MSEEQARALVKQIIGESFGHSQSISRTGRGAELFINRLAAALREARAKGLEEAAQVAEDWHDHDITPGSCCYKKIATACRTQAQQARKEGP